MPAHAEDAGTRVPKAAELVASRIRRQIVTGRFAEGQLLPPETELLDALKVSRPTLRQAFRILEVEGLIAVQRGARGGALVRTPSRELAGRYLGVLLQRRGTKLADLHAAQVLIEPAAVAHLARKRDRSGLTELREIVERERGATEPGERRRVADHFHVRLVEIAGNATLTAFDSLLHHLMRAHSERAVRLHRQQGERTPLAGEPADHQRVLELIGAGAAHEAARHWRDHLVRERDALATAGDLDAGLDLEI